MDGHIGDQKINSDKTWKLRKSNAYQNTQKVKPANYRLPEGNVRYVAHEELVGWEQPDFDDTDWLQTVELGEEGTSPWNQIYKRPIPQWKDFGLKKVADLRKEGNTAVVKLPYNMQFSYWIKVRAKQGKLIKVTTDSYPWLNDTPISSEYITKDGIQEYEHFPWMSGHEIHIEWDEGVELLEAGYRETGYDTEMDGNFSIDDPFLMKLIEKANRTLYVNMRDTYFDCPDRERAQWWGDLVLLMEESFYALDNQAIGLSQKAINELVDWQKKDGTLFSPIPAGNWDRELPQQMLAAIALGFKNYYLFTGDLKTIEHAYEPVKRYLQLWEVSSEGRVDFKKGGWNWSDWGEQIDTGLLEHAWYYMALISYSDFSKYLGKHIESQQAFQQAAKIKRYVNQHFWTPEGYRSKNYKDEIDDRGNAMMVVAGIAALEQHDTISQLLKNIRHSSPYMDKYVLEALFLMNKESQAIARIKDRYRAMVDSELTTLWELFSQGDWSYNHGWSGGPLSMLYKYVAGIRPVEPGFAQFEVFPQYAGYDSISTSFSTLKGVISMQTSCGTSATQIHLQVPKKSQAIIRIPKEKTALIEGGRRFKMMEEKTDQNYHYYLLDEGEWEVVF